MNGMPKYATKRNPGNPSFGERVAVAAQLLGGEFMPWQRMVADVGCELDVNNPGAWRYDVVVVTVPRQAGKSFMLRAVMVDRMMNYTNREILMTAQTGKDARKRWNQIKSALSADKKTGYFRIRASQGSERLEYLKTGSYISPFAPTPKSIHGDSLHLVTVDEAWAFDADSGLALETAINPTQLTIKDSQLWIVSTKGTSASAYLNELIRKGREAVSDPYSRIAYFEWSADEEAADADPYSDETLSFHPAIGHTQTAEKIRALATGDLSAWRRSILNLETATDSTIIEISIWDALENHEAPRPFPKNVSIAFDIARDRSASTIYAAWQDGENTRLEAVATGEGTAWVTPMLTHLAEKGYAGIYCDPAGSTRTLFQDLKDAGIPIIDLSTREYATACQLFLDRVKDGSISHDGSPEIRAALQAVETRNLAGVTAWDGAKSPEPIDALRAATVALWASSQPKYDPIQIF